MPRRNGRDNDPARILKQKLETAAAAPAALRRIEVDELTIRRRRNGKGFQYLGPGGKPICNPRLLTRLKRLAVPPAYEDVFYAADTSAHIQAIGRDSAGRAQYRYHPEWDKVREMRKAQQLARLLRLLPKIRRAIARYLRDKVFSREFASAAAIDLIAATAIRPGSEAYAREHGTRGAATLLQSDVSITGDRIALKFRGKGGKQIERSVRSPRLARVLKRLKTLPGRRLFQYRAQNGDLYTVRRRDVNDFLHAIAGDAVSLKDFRTLAACGRALEHLATLTPKPSEAGRRRQLNGALEAVAAELANTPAICRKSYVHAVVVGAFEEGRLAKVAARASGPVKGERLLTVLLNAVTR